MQRKIISREKFAKIIKKYKWAPVKLPREHCPTIFKNIPKEKIVIVAASGDFTEPIEEVLHEQNISGVVGGIDVVRWDKNDVKIGKPFNKDHYIVLETESDDILIIEGPLKDNEHWLSEIPVRLEKAKILEFNGENEY